MVGYCVLETWLPSIYCKKTIPKPVRVSCRGGFVCGTGLLTQLKWYDGMQLDNGVEVAFIDQRRFARVRLLEDVWFLSSGTSSHYFCDITYCCLPIAAEFVVQLPQKIPF